MILFITFLATYFPAGLCGCIFFKEEFFIKKLKGIKNPPEPCFYKITLLGWISFFVGLFKVSKLLRSL